MALISCDFYSDADLRPGERDRGFWDAEIQTVLDWLPRAAPVDDSGNTGPSATSPADRR